MVALTNVGGAGRRGLSVHEGEWAPGASAGRKLASANENMIIPELPRAGRSRTLRRHWTVEHRPRSCSVFSMRFVLRAACVLTRARPFLCGGAGSCGLQCAGAAMWMHKWGRPHERVLCAYNVGAGCGWRKRRGTLSRGCSAARSRSLWKCAGVLWLMCRALRSCGCAS